MALDARRREDAIRAFAVHPGSILGPLARHLSDAEIDAFGARNANGSPVIAPDRDMKTPSQGAATSIRCPTSPMLDGMGGVYCVNSNVASSLPEGAMSQPGVVPWAIDPETAERLWATSIRMTGTDLE